LSRLATSFVLSFHSCDKSVGEQALQGNLALIHSDKDYDWLGPGVYFWENDPYAPSRPARRPSENRTRNPTSSVRLALLQRFSKVKPPQGPMRIRRGTLTQCMVGQTKAQ
jgi:hypothetical protein